ncbi:hypothetical protein B296_00039031 [Ensete ventricosum]|uniref:Uncharacterized protein n=1 Tax=Ensete ventricosum TaxID=4639 RepID=A0A426ZUP1_ENSVE|nr:hypothetical protein B296_00039031 [Ensete ventricosum]
MAAESYTLAASSTVLNVSSHTRMRIQKSRIVAANFPHDHRREQRIRWLRLGRRGLRQKKGEERVLRLGSVAGVVGQRRRCCGQLRAAAAANSSAVVEAGAGESRRLRLKRRRKLSFDSEKKFTLSSPWLLDPLLKLALEVAEAGMEEVELVMRPDMDLGMYGSRYGNGPGGGSAGGYGKPLVMGVGNGSCYGEGAGAGNARGYGKSGVGDGVGEKIL